MIKCLTICSMLFTAIKYEQWDEANRLVDELRDTLRTYKTSC